MLNHDDVKLRLTLDEGLVPCHRAALACAPRSLRCGSTLPGHRLSRLSRSAPRMAPPGLRDDSTQQRSTLKFSSQLGRQHPPAWPECRSDLSVASKWEAVCPGPR